MPTLDFLTTMNLYQVISEELSTVIPVLDYGEGPLEYYHIAEIVAAETRGQAKWIAWKSDEDSFEGNICDMPKFSVHLIKKNVNDPKGVCTDKWEHLFRNF